MIKLEYWNVAGWDPAIRGMRNPMNSWDKIDSMWCSGVGSEEHIVVQVFSEDWLLLGPNDQDLMKRLAKAGSDHRKFMRMITVYVDITAPLYWWKEFDTYKVGTVANSCSTMHKIADKEFTLDDFSHERIIGNFKEGFEDIVRWLNSLREDYIENKDEKYWYTMIQLLPTSYNQKRTVMLNYEVLRNMYHARKNHKLDEWHDFCDWVESLPYSELITGEE